MLKPEVTHGASGRANIKRIARSHQHHAQIVELMYRSQPLILSHLPPHLPAIYPRRCGTRSLPHAHTRIENGGTSRALRANHWAFPALPVRLQGNKTKKALRGGPLSVSNHEWY